MPRIAIHLCPGAVPQVKRQPEEREHNSADLQATPT